MSCLLHFRADPDGADEDARKAGMSDEDFAREHGLDFTSFAGKKVYPGFSDAHITDKIFYSPEHMVLRSMDFGYHHPAVVYGQLFGNLLWVLGEVMGENQSLDRFVDDVMLPYEAALFGEGAKFATFADIAGRQVSDKSEYTSFAILSNRGIHPIAKKTEINEGLTLIRQKIADGSFVVHPRCRLLIEGMKGGYRYPITDPGKPEALLPLKDGFYDHLQDSLRYLVVNNLSLINKKDKPKADPDPPGYRAVVERRKKQGTDSTYGEWF